MKPLEMLKQLNDWRRQDADVESMIRVVLRAEGRSSLSLLAADKPDVIEALYDSAEQIMGPELEVSRPEHL